MKDTLAWKNNRLKLNHYKNITLSKYVSHRDDFNMELKKSVKQRTVFKKLIKFYIGSGQHPFTDLPMTMQWNVLVISSSLKQYKPYIFGYSNNYFKTTSAGILLKKKGLVVKSLKKSKKALKATFEYLQPLIENHSLYFIILKPFNKKSFKLLEMMHEEGIPDYVNIGFVNYYNTIFRKIRRIKKNIKKKLLLSERM